MWPSGPDKFRSHVRYGSISRPCGRADPFLQWQLMIVLKSYPVCQAAKMILCALARRPSHIPVWQSGCGNDAVCSSSAPKSYPGVPCRTNEATYCKTATKRRLLKLVHRTPPYTPVRPPSLCELSVKVIACGPIWRLSYVVVTCPAPNSGRERAI